MVYTADTLARETTKRLVDVGIEMIVILIVLERVASAARTAERVTVAKELFHRGRKLDVALARDVRRARDRVGQRSTDCAGRPCGAAHARECSSMMVESSVPLRSTAAARR